MARTKEFDPEVALQKAVEVVWRLGYERTSLDMLMRAMGISKQIASMPRITSPVHHISVLRHIP
jgi:hypothetical protein